ncbi:MAG: hypothetical protein A3J24_01130 [Deltaproteobacteria bacterium RIFCSPLOWO2_02_FULL_53_8]|nr:MAG: hypothetical protein A3J24_01130 [Deltaproteobacteria bacterium RIFCSPLOWO2_02_FULL_53_8]
MRLDIALWVRMAALFLLRSGRSSVVLSLMVLASVAILIFLSAMAVGVNDAMVRNSTAIYPGHITGFDLPQSVRKDGLVAPGVKAVLKRRIERGILTVPSSAQVETINLIRVNPLEEARYTALPEKLAAGRYLSLNDGEIFISQEMAEGLGAGPGSVLRFRDARGRAVELKVCGTYRTGLDNLDRGIAFASLAGEGGGPWQAAVFLEDGADASSIIGGYKNKIGGALFKSWEELMPDLKQLIDLNYVSMVVVMALVFGVVAIGIASAFSVFILKKMREYGIMKSMGVSLAELILLVGSEIVMLNLVASILGLVLGAAAVLIAGSLGIDLAAFTSHNRYFAVSGIVCPRLTVFSLVLPPVLAMVFGLVAAIWPVSLVARSSAAQILREAQT